MDAAIVTLIERFGFPVFCTIVLGWVIYRICTWMLSNVALPLVDSHRSFLSIVSDNVSQQTQILRGMSEQMQENRTELRGIRLELPKVCIADCPPVKAH